MGRLQFGPCFSLYVFAVCLVNAVICDVSLPALGIGLGPKYITAAQGFKDGTVTEVAQIEGSACYKDAFAYSSKSRADYSSWIPRGYTVAALQADFFKLKRAAEASLGQAVSHIVMSTPEYSDTNSILNFRNAAQAAGLSDYVPRIGAYEFPWSNAIQQAYELDTCHGRGLPDDCNFEDDVVVLVLTYNMGYLELALVDVPEPPLSSTLRARLTLSGFGEASSSGFGSEYHIATIREQLTIFIWSNMIAEVLPYRHKDWKPSVGSLNAVILCGDATRSGFGSLRSVVSEVFQDSSRFTGLQREWLKDYLSPVYVPAFGAARRAKHMADEPDEYQVFGVFDNQVQLHDELW